MSQNIVIRPIRWLHMSDIHMRVSNAWSQDVVLKAMCNHVARQRADGMKLDFIFVTGDLTFSGKADEYKLAAVLAPPSFSLLSVLPQNAVFIPINP